MIEDKKVIRLNSTKYVLLELVAVMFFATAGIFVRKSTLTPANAGIWRMLLALPFLFFMGNKYLKDMSKLDIFLAFVSGLCMAGDLALFNIALVTTSLANTNLLTNLTALIIVPFSYFIFKEKIPKYYFIGLITAIVGVIILVNGKVNPTPTNYMGDLFAALACFFYSFYILITYRLRDRVNASAILIINAIGAIFGLSIVAIIQGGLQRPTNIKEFLNLFIYSFCMQMIGQPLFTYCQGKVSVNLSIAITLMQPVFAAIYSLIFFNEKLSFVEIIGLIIVIVGVCFCKFQFDTIKIKEN